MHLEAEVLHWVSRILFVSEHVPTISSSSSHRKTERGKEQSSGDVPHEYIKHGPGHECISDACSKVTTFMQFCHSFAFLTTNSSLISTITNCEDSCWTDKLTHVVPWKKKKKKKNTPEIFCHNWFHLRWRRLLFFLFFKLLSPLSFLHKWSIYSLVCGFFFRVGHVWDAAPVQVSPIQRKVVSDTASTTASGGPTCLEMLAMSDNRIGMIIYCWKT